MVSLTNRSIDLMEQIARDTDNRIGMTRRGYAIATREQNIDTLVSQLRSGLGDESDTLVRYHDQVGAPGYLGSSGPDASLDVNGVDILCHYDLIRKHFPYYDPEVQTVVHIRRGGDINSQQLATYMLEYLKSVGAKRLMGQVRQINSGNNYQIEIDTRSGSVNVVAGQIVNAAGPFAGAIAKWIGVELPIINVFQQKIAFEDHLMAIPRNQPFSIDLDRQQIDWSDSERSVLRDDPQFARFAGDMPGGIHCRPEGGDGGKWIKLGWAYNEEAALNIDDQPLDAHFPEIVLRGAARLNPSLRAYYGRLPQACHHYGGWYSMTEENWPLIGGMGPEGAFMNCAMSGFGTMTACASGELCAATICEARLPSYAEAFSLARYEDWNQIDELRKSNKGIL